MVSLSTKIQAPFNPSRLSSPPVQVERLKTSKASVLVAREDLLPGGTKQRALIPFLKQLLNEGYREVVYASPFCGFAQVALAICGKQLGMAITLICEANPSEGDELQPHEFTKIAQSYGARIFLKRTLGTCESAAHSYEINAPGCFKVPLGFRDPRYMCAMEEAIRFEYQSICHRLNTNPTRIFLPVGSGTLAEIFTRIVKPEQQLLCLNVRVLPEDDSRLRFLRTKASIDLRHADEDFPEPSRHYPPIPSNKHYDAKLWNWIRLEATDGDLWWNVGP